jgi:hypothetical protein
MSDTFFSDSVGFKFLKKLRIVPDGVITFYFFNFSVNLMLYHK